MSKSNKSIYLAPSLGNIYFDGSIPVRPSQNHGGGGESGDDFSTLNNKPSKMKIRVLDDAAPASVLPDGVAPDQIEAVIPVPESPEPDSE